MIEKSKKGRLLYAAYFAELVSLVTVEDEASEVLRLFLNTLYCIETKENPEFIKLFLKVSPTLTIL